LELIQTLAENVLNNEFIIFGKSSHIIFLEKEVELRLAVSRNFVERTIARKYDLASSSVRLKGVRGTYTIPDDRYWRSGDFLAKAGIVGKDYQAE